MELPHDGESHMWFPLILTVWCAAVVGCVAWLMHGVFQSDDSCIICHLAGRACEDCPQYR